jgi:hypothetical protein
MRRMHLAIAIAIAIIVPLKAQTTKTQPPAGTPAPAPQSTGKPTAKPALGGMMTKPIAEMQKLNFMLGNWTTAEKFEPNDFAPKGGAAKGEAQIHEGPGGLSLIENYRSRNGPFGPFRGHAIVWWDGKTGVYKSFWCDSMMACQNSFGVGKWEGDKLIFSGESEYQGKKISMRSTFSDIKPDSFTWTEETSTDGGPMKPSMTIQYVLSPKPAQAAKPNPKM